MDKVFSFFKNNKKVIALSFLVILLILILCFFNIKDKNENSVSKSDDEIKLSELLSQVDGVGNADVLIREQNEKIIGIIVVCEGANDIMVRNNLINLISTAFNVDRNIIAIYLMKI